MGRVLTVLLAFTMCTFAARAHARAPDTFEEDYAEPVMIESPQWFAFELRLGPYKPALRSRQETFANDSGWLLNLEADFTVFHLPYDIGQVNVAGVFGWSSYDAYARLADPPPDDPNARSGEKTGFTIFPLAALAVLRIDALARHTVVPFTFAAKMGYEWVRWKAEAGAYPKQTGFNKGLRYALQAALELDFFNPDAARSLDEDFGINHTYLLFEYMNSKTKGTGDDAFMFGLGAQF